MLAQDTTTVPYCGPPPSPAALWLSWNFDPVLVGALAALACLYALGCTRLDQGGGGRGAGEKAAFYTGWLITALALVSPLCPLSVSLFAVRVGQHMMLTLLAAPRADRQRPSPQLLLFRRGGVRGCGRRRCPLPVCLLQCCGSGMPPPRMPPPLTARSSTGRCIWGCLAVRFGCGTGCSTPARQPQ
jgi:caa3-type cytochrome oxidase assembly factor Caa3/CtaG